MHISLSLTHFRPAQSRMIAAIHAARRLREKARESRRESEGDARGGFRGKAIRRGAIAVQAAVRLANAADPQEDESLRDGPTAAQSSPGSIVAGRRLPGSDYFLHVKLQWLRPAAAGERSLLPAEAAGGLPAVPISMVPVPRGCGNRSQLHGQHCREGEEDTPLSRYCVLIRSSTNLESHFRDKHFREKHRLFRLHAR